jgi:ubiquinone/menaquinone biosynthesis C-methylase UbiE
MVQSKGLGSNRKRSESRSALPTGALIDQPTRERWRFRCAFTAADDGAGTGYFTVRLAERVPEGRVFAVDVQPEMLDILRRRLAREDIDNVESMLGREDDPRLRSNSIDAALLVDAYHESAYPREMMQGIVAALRPGGQVILVEYCGEGPSLPIKLLNRMTEAQARREMTAAGLRHVATLGVLPTQHVLIFGKPAAR